MKCNVVLIVLDTLRLDYSEDLDDLISFGFVKHYNVISQSPWTLPSHFSMLTGFLPSVHAVHEGEGLGLNSLRNLSKGAVAKRPTLINNLKEIGYRTYGGSANPFVSSDFGFQFDQLYEVDHFGEINDARRLLRWQDIPLRPRTLLGKRAFGTLLRLGYYRVYEELMGSLGRQQMEKGSKSIIKCFSKMSLEEPFFLFVNFMEAHERYRWNEDDLGKVVVSSILGRPNNAAESWKNMYQGHAQLAISRAKEFIHYLLKFDPLVIVTSDHGQLLGENNRYGHGYFLDNALVQVPLYIRYPRGAKSPNRNAGFVSLTDIPRIVTSVIENTEMQIGSEFAFSQSFGSQFDLRRYLQEEEAAFKIRQIYSRRTKAFSKDGSLIFNHDSRIVEEATDDLTPDNIRSLVDIIPKEVSARPRILSTGQQITSEDERYLGERLKALGYE